MLTLFVQVLEELNAILLIVAPLLCTTCIDPYPLVGRGSCSRLSLCLLSWKHKTLGEFFYLLVVLSHVDTINNTIVAIDSFLLMDTHNYKLFECLLVIHGVVIHLEGFKFLRD
jgi:hypothetical protein